MKESGDSVKKPPFPTFASQAEAEAYSDETGDAYYEICYHLEGGLNLSLKTIHELYATSLPNKRPKMQRGVVRDIICSEGWPRHPRTLVCMLVACSRYRHEETCHAYTVNEAMRALVLEKEHHGTLRDAAFHSATFEPISKLEADNMRADLLRLCDWIESRFHYGTHQMWYLAPDCFSDDPEKVHLANLGITQRYLAKFSERDQKRWEEMLKRAAVKHQSDLKMWATVGKTQYDPNPRTWTHPEIDALIIGIWPLVARYNWTYSDLLNVLGRFFPQSDGGCDHDYPLDSVESLKVHCRNICGLTKLGKGKSATGLPTESEIAFQLFSPPESK